MSKGTHVKKARTIVVSPNFIKTLLSIKMLKLTQFIARRATVTNLVGNYGRAFSASTTPPSDAADVDPDAPVDMPNPFQKEKRKCILCQLSISPSYKNVKLLSQFQSPYTGRIYGRHITGLCKQKQEEVEKAIIRAQNCALMPSYHKDLDFLADPRLFDPERPIRPHKY